jgi:hypothetical protein
MQSIFAGSATQMFNFTTLYVRVGTPQGVAATGDVIVYFAPLP